MATAYEKKVRKRKLDREKRTLRSTDPFTDSVIESMTPDVVESFSPEQLEALRTALKRNTRWDRKHAIDIRLTIPLFITRFYLVFLFGRDRRNSAKEVLSDRRKRVGKLAGFLNYGLVLSATAVVLVILLAAGLYLLKSVLGINLFDRTHLHDWIWHLLNDGPVE